MILGDIKEKSLNLYVVWLQNALINLDLVLDIPVMETNAAVGRLGLYGTFYLIDDYV